MAGFEVTSLLEKLWRLRTHHAHLISGIDKELELVVKDLSVWKAFLLEHDEEEDEAIDKVKREIKKCVYEVDDSIDAYLTQMAASKVKNFLAGFLFSRRINSCRKFSPVQMDNVVGRDDEENTIINFLMKPEPGVISIVGVGGLGKSTLARKIYVNTRIAYEFPVRIWIHIPYFNLDDILRNILRVFTSQDMHSLSHEELSENVEACLKKKKFLLVLDNIWNLYNWEAIKVVLPNSNNMGKVLITTRASNIGEPPNFNIINLRFLDAEESWKLLQLKLFGNLEHCLFELEAAARSLAHRCDGLPLNIVLVGGILKWQLMKSSTPDPIKDDVLKVCEKVNMETFNMVRLAYMRLSDELRQCFLYTGVFPKDYEISAWTLTRLWIAEGFVRPVEGHSLEEAATRNLAGLIGMNLVMVDKINPFGKVKTCRVHNIVTSFLWRKAKEHELFQRLSLVDKGSICRRICVDSYANINLLSKVPKSPGVRSVLCVSEPPPTGMDPSYTSTILNTFHLLKVLDSKSIKTHKLPQQITKLLHLRYVTLFVDIINTLPEPLSELWNLETLVVHTKSRVITMEANIWRLIRLRHLKTNAAIILSSDNQGQGLAGENLQTLTRLSPEFCTTDVSERARNLKSLGIRGDLEIIFGKMFLERFDLLEKLKLIHDVFPKMSSENPLHQLPPPNHFPPNLKWLTLSHTHLLWDRDMPTLANIETLEVLKLKDDAFTGVIWRGPTEDCFPSLKFFLIENTNLVLWKASTKSLPRLSCLVLKNCENLREIPEAIAENLERLEIERLGKSAVDSARRIADRIAKRKKD